MPQNKNKAAADSTRKDKKKLKQFRFGVSLDQLPCTYLPDYGNLVTFLVEAGEIIRQHVDVEGLFRISAGLSRQDELKLQAEQGQGLKGDVDVHEATGLVKMFFRLLPEPLVPCLFHDPFLASMELPEAGGQRTEAIQELCFALPASHLSCLRYFMKLLVHITRHAHSNRMNARNLAVVLTPSLIRLKARTKLMSREELRVLPKQTVLIEHLIRHADGVGCMTPKLYQHSLQMTEELLQKKLSPKKKKKNGNRCTDVEERLGAARAVLNVVATLHFRPNSSAAVSDAVLVDGPYRHTVTTSSLLHNLEPQPASHNRREAGSMTKAPLKVSGNKPCSGRCRNKPRKRLRNSTRRSSAPLERSNCKAMLEPLIQSWSTAIPFIPYSSKSDSDLESCYSEDSFWSDEDADYSDSDEEKMVSEAAEQVVNEHLFLAKSTNTSFRTEYSSSRETVTKEDRKLPKNEKNIEENRQKSTEECKLASKELTYSDEVANSDRHSRADCHSVFSEERKSNAGKEENEFQTTIVTSTSCLPSEESSKLKTADAVQETCDQSVYPSEDQVKKCLSQQESDTDQKAEVILQLTANLSEPELQQDCKNFTSEKVSKTSLDNHTKDEQTLIPCNAARTEDLTTKMNMNTACCSLPDDTDQTNTQTVLEESQLLPSEQCQKDETHSGTLNQHSQSADVESKTLNERSQSADVESKTLNERSQSADVESKTLNERSQSADADSGKPNQHSQSADADSGKPNQLSQSADADSGKPNQHSRSADDECKALNERSQSAADESKTLNERSQSADDESKTLNKRSQSAADESKTLNQCSESADDKSKALNKRSQSADDESKTLNERSQSADDESKTLNQHSQSADDDSKALNQHSQSADDDSKALNQRSQSADDESKAADDESKTLNQYSQSADDENKTLNQCSQSADVCNKIPNQCSQSADADSGKPNQHSQSADAHSGKPNQHSQSADADSGKLNQHSQSADADSGKLNQHSQSADADSGKLNQCSQSADADSGKLNQHSQSADADSGKLNQCSQSADTDSGKPNQHSQNADADSGKLNQCSQSADAESKTLNERSQNADDESGKPNHHSQSVDADSGKPNQLSQSADADSGKPNHHSQSADADSGKPNQLSQSEDADSGKPNQHSQSADADSGKPNQHSQSVDADSGKPNQLSQSADSDSGKPNQHSQSADADSGKPNQHSQSADADSGKPNRHSQSADADSGIPNQHSQSVDADSGKPNQLSQSADDENVKSNQHSQNADDDSGKPNQHSQNADDESKTLNERSQSADADSGKLNQHSQRAIADCETLSQLLQSTDGQQLPLTSRLLSTFLQHHGILNASAEAAVSAVPVTQPAGRLKKHLLRLAQRYQSMEEQQASESTNNDCIQEQNWKDEKESTSVPKTDKDPAISELTPESERSLSMQHVTNQCKLSFPQTQSIHLTNPPNVTEELPYNNNMDKSSWPLGYNCKKIQII